MLVVNSPWFFKSCWKIVKPLIDPITAKKIIFTSSEKLVNHIPKEVLPVNLGGTNDSLVNFGLGKDLIIHQLSVISDEGSQSETISHSEK